MEPRPNSRRRGFWLGLGGLIAGLFLIVGGGCQKQMLNKEATHGLASDPYPVAPKKLAEKLRILVWPDTILEENKQDFERRYDVKMEIVTFANNDEAYDRLIAEPKKWDLVMVSQYMGDRLRREKLLRPVTRLNDFIYQYIDTSLLNEHADPHMQYFIPFDYSVLGISFNIDYMAGFPRKWVYISDHMRNPYLYGRIALPDDMRYAMATAMLYLGLDPASTKPQDIDKVKELLVRSVKDLGLRFVPDPKVRSEMLRQDSLMAITWSAEAAGILRSKSSCRFLIPEGKSIMSLDGFCIPKDAPSPETATLFIEYMLHPYSSLIVANATMYASVNMRTMKYVDRFIINGPSCMLADPGDRIHMKHLNGEELKRYQEAWAEIKKAELDASRINLIPRL